jgi:hypothetical protein
MEERDAPPASDFNVIAPTRDQRRYFSSQSRIDFPHCFPQVLNVGDAAELSASYDSYGSNYVADLERRLKTAEASLQQSKPCPPMPPLYARAIRSIEKPFSPPHPEDSEFADIADSFRALSLGNAPPDPGFRGKSSAAMLVKAAVVVTSGGGTTAPQTCYRTPPATEPWTRPVCLPSFWGNAL